MFDEDFAFCLSAIGAGITPDPDLWIDEWADKHMVLPRRNAAEHGKYRTDRTAPAREVMRCLSPGHPCKRVVAVVASQMWKTQVGINWISASIHQAPANALVLLPTDKLAKRVSARFAETFKAVPVLTRAVSQPRSRDSRNTVDTKEFDGGALFITTAGSASNLAEVPARYIYCDEIDRWKRNVGGEGDGRKLAEARQTTYERTRKGYYTSSPTWTGLSEIWTLYEAGTQNICEIPCGICGTHHELVWENMRWDAGLTQAWMVCPYCDARIEESAKAIFMRPGMYRWRAQAVGDGETESFHYSALYAPLGWIGWLKLAKEFVDAERAENEGNNELMQVFRNTRLALCHQAGRLVATADELEKRAEDYVEMVVPWGGLIVTAGVDVQHDRLALVLRAWGRGEESWLLYWGEIPGSTLVAGQGAWVDLEQFLFGVNVDDDGVVTYRRRQIEHVGGAQLTLRAISLDTSDGQATQDAAYAFCRKHKARGVMAVKGGSERAQDRLEIFAPPKPAVDADKKNKAWKFGLKPFIVGTNKAKDLILEARLALLGSGPARLHWYKTVRPDYWDQLLAEIKVPSPTRRGRKVWEKKSGVHNEALDCEVYALHAARSLKIHLYKPHHWEALERNIRQPDLLAQITNAPAVLLEADAGEESVTPSDSLPAEASSAVPVSHEKPNMAPAPAVARRPARPKSRGGFSTSRW